MSNFHYLSVAFSCFKSLPQAAFSGEGDQRYGFQSAGSFLILQKQLCHQFSMSSSNALIDLNINFSAGVKVTHLP